MTHVFFIEVPKVNKSKKIFFGLVDKFLILNLVLTKLVFKFSIVPTHKEHEIICRCIKNLYLNQASRECSLSHNILSMCKF